MPGNYEKPNCEQPVGYSTTILNLGGVKNRLCKILAMLQQILEALEREEPANVVSHYGSITVSTTPVLLDRGMIVGMTGALITVENASIRFRCDGANPTATEGHQINDGDELNIEGEKSLNQFRAIRKDSSDATLRVSYKAKGE